MQRTHTMCVGELVFHGTHDCPADSIIYLLLLLLSFIKRKFDFRETVKNVADEIPNGQNIVKKGSTLCYDIKSSV